jgi:4-amino-4-deoxy-L-arabinose transferase-like glycosyltransferase
MGNSRTGNLPILHIGLVALGLFALYFAGMGSYPLVDPDEPVYGQVAKEMAAGAGWLTPHYNSGPWFDKPPLFYWLSGFSARVLGPTELACRLPSALLAVAVLLLVYFLVKHDFGSRAALFAALAMGTCLQTIILARAAVTDMTLLFCLLGALYAYRRWFDADGPPRFGWMALCGAMTGLGMLAKGPVAPLLLFATFFIHLWRCGRLRRLVSWDVLVGIAVTLIVGLPWFVAMYVLHHDAFVHQFIEVNNFTRFLKPEHAKVTGGWYSYFLNIPVLFVFFFPWSVFLPAGLLRFRSANPGAKLAAIWFAVVFVFFSVSKTQLVTYIFPLYPAAALFVGVLLDRAASGDMGIGKAVRRSLVAGLIYSALLAAGLVVMARSKYPEAGMAAGAMAATLLLAAAIAFALRGRPSRAAWAIGTGMAVFALLLMFCVVPKLGSSISTRDIVRTIPSVADGRVAEWNLRKPSLLFYLDFEPEHLSSVFEAKRQLGEEVSTWVLCKDKDAPLLRVENSSEAAQMGGLSVIANESAANRKGPVRN